MSHHIFKMTNNKVNSIKINLSKKTIDNWSVFIKLSTCAKLVDKIALHQRYPPCQGASCQKGAGESSSQQPRVDWA